MKVDDPTRSYTVKFNNDNVNKGSAEKLPMNSESMINMTAANQLNVT